jgi:predicted aspartyl protease
MKPFSGFLVLLLSPAAFCQDAKSIVVPFDTLRSRHMIIDVKINGQGPYTLIFDTGAPFTLISSKLAKEAKMPIKGGFALFGTFGQQKINSLEMGDIKLEKIEAMVMDHPIVDAIAGATGKKIDGIVGFNVFGRYKTTIDYQDKKLTFAPSTFKPANMMDNMMKALMLSANDLERVPVIAPRGMIGLVVAKKDGDEEAGVLVEKVYAGTPAAKAGILPGDRILTIDHRWTDRVADCFEALRAAQPGEAIAVEIVRDGKAMPLKLTTANGF